ncbi:hypothetical protein BDZ85DRAFT_276243 [Elsinoe ampelina]|uniref:Bul1 C-terminal domain-containing protein n=1 Tax=Elsinoe ampelina TaxID=302913 RepID=A0A6A6G199_9PEZI|nr:hypothetical protein BDZ85DRAFT_276243 [Elsinoe ampelina]
MKSTRPQIRIAIDGAEDSWVMTYSTLDRIEGKVYITCPVKTNIESLSIDFIGTTKTFVEKLSTATAISGRTEAMHQFLKLSQPIPQASWPTGRVLEANQTYEFKFIFVVPAQLLPRICRHNVTSSTVQQEHLKLPPSLGDRTVSGRGKTLLDDISPDMARIKYGIVVAVQESDTNGPFYEPVTKIKKVRIVPAVDEAPPLTVEGPDNDYRLRAEKDIRKNIFKPKLGTLVVEAAQPKSLRVPSHKSEEASIESTVATINLRFDPADAKAQPPKLGGLGTKLKTTTFFSSSARCRVPSKNDMQWDFSQGMHSESISLASRCMSMVKWDFHEDTSRPNSLERRDSTSSTSSAQAGTIEASSKYRGNGYYTAKVLVPISLPANKAWIPTFHSCLVSRVYALYMHLNVASGTMGGIDLKIPVQISSEGNPEVLTETRNSLTLEEQAIEAFDADEFFLPRTVSPMDARLALNSNLSNQASADLPPEYDAFPRTGSRIPVMV